MVFALSEDERSARGRKKTSHPLLSQTLGKSLRAMARQHSGLVHQPTSLVGTSNTGVVPPESEVRGQRSEVRNLCRCEAAEGSGKLDPRRRHTRYLVFIVALGL